MIPRSFFRNMLRSLFSVHSPRKANQRVASRTLNRMQTVAAQTETLEDRTLLSVSVILASPTQVEFNSDVFGGNDDVVLRAVDGVLEYDINDNGFERDVDPATTGVQEFQLAANSRIFADINGVLFIDDMTNAAGTFISLDDLEIHDGAQISTRIIPVVGSPETSPSLGNSENITFQAPDIVAGDGVSIFAGVEAGSAFAGGTVQFIARASKDLTWDSVIPLFNDVDASASITLGAVEIDAADIIIDADTTTSKFAAFEIDQAALLDVVDNEFRATFTGEVVFDDNDDGGDTITRSGGSWIADGFEIGQILDVTGTLNNNNTPTLAGTLFNPEVYEIAAVTDTVITLTASDILADETAPMASILQGAPNLIGNPELTFRTTGTPFPRLERPGNAGSFVADGFEADELLDITDSETPANSGLYRVRVASNQAVELESVASVPETSAGVELTFGVNEDGISTISRAVDSGDFFLDGFQIGSFIEVTGSNSNDTNSTVTRYQITSLTATELTLDLDVVFSEETTTSAVIREIVVDVDLEAASFAFIPDNFDSRIEREADSGSFLQEGFQPGQIIFLEGTEEGNDGSYTIVDVTDNALILSDFDVLNPETGTDITITTVLTTLPPERIPLVPLDRDGNPIPSASEVGIFAEDIIDNLKVGASALSSFINTVAGVAQGNITDATSDVVIGSGSVFRATGDVLITSHTDAEVTLSSPGLSIPLVSSLVPGNLGFPVGAGFGVSEAESNATIEGNVTITAGGVFRLDSQIDNTLAVTMSSASGLIMGTGTAGAIGIPKAGPASFPVQIPFPAITLAYGRGRSDSEAVIESGATVSATEAFVTAANNNNFNVSAGSISLFPRTNFGQGAAIAVSDIGSDSEARVDGNIIESVDQGIIPNNVQITARSTNANNDVSARSTIKDKVAGSGLGGLVAAIPGEATNVLKNKFTDVETFLKNDKGTSIFGFSAGLAIAVSSNEAEAIVGKNAKINAATDVTIDAEVEDNFRGTALGGAGSPARVAIGGAINFGRYVNEADAFIDTGAELNVGGDLFVTSDAIIPNQVSADDDVLNAIQTFSELQFDPPGFGVVDDPFNSMIDAYERVGDDLSVETAQQSTDATSDFITALSDSLSANAAYAGGVGGGVVGALVPLLTGFLPPRLGIDKQTTTYTNASASGKTEGVDDSNPQKGLVSFGGTFNVLVVENDARASIESGAFINQDEAFFALINPNGPTAGNNVKVEADASIQTVNIGGLATPLALLSDQLAAGPSGDTAAIGGNLAAVVYENTARAYIADAVRIRTEEDVVVDAEGDIISIALGQAGGSGKFGFAGAFSGNALLMTAESAIDDSAIINAGLDVQVLAENDLVAIGATLVFENGQKVGVGVSAAVNVFDVTTEAFIGERNSDNPSTTMGSISAGRDVRVDADTEEFAINIALAGAVTSGTPNPPSNPGNGNTGAGTGGSNWNSSFNRSGVGNNAQGVQIGQQREPEGKLATIKSGLAGLGTKISTGVKDALPAPPDGKTGDGIKGLRNRIQGGLQNGNGNETTGVSISGDVIVNVILDTTRAYIADDVIITASTENPNEGTIAVIAESDLITIASTAAIAGGISQKGASIAGSLTSDNLVRKTEAYVTNTSIAGHDVFVQADSDHQHTAVAVGGAGNPSASTQSGSVAGSAGVHIVLAETMAELTTNATMTGDVTVDAVNNSQILSLAGVVAVDGGLAAGGASDVIILTNDTVAKIGGGSVITTDGNVNVSATNQEDILAAAAGLAISNNKVGISGSAALQVIVTEASARIDDGAQVTADGNVTVDGDDRVRMLSLAGAAAGGNKAGVGAAISGNFIFRDVEAKIGKDAKVTALAQETNPAGILVTADAEDSIITFAASGAVGQQVGVAANWAPLVIVSNTRAFVDEGAELNQTTGGTNSQSVQIQADHDTDIISIAGAVGISVNNAGIGGALSTRGLYKNVQAFIADDATVDANRHVDIEASSRERMLSAVAGGAVAQGFAGAGAISADVIVVDTQAFIGDRATVTAEGNVLVSAVSESQTFALVGQAAASGGSAAVGGTNATLIRVDTTEAWIGENATVTANANRGTSDVFNGNRNGAFGIGSKNTESLRGVSVTAVSFDDVVLVSIGGAISNSAGVSGSVSDYVMIETTRAFIDDNAMVNLDRTNAHANQTVNVLASDKTDTIGFAGGLGIGSSAGVGASADFAALVKDTIAFVGESATVNASRDVRVNAVSDEDIISLAVNLEFSGGTSVAGAGSSYVFVTTTRAAIEDNATIWADGNVVVNAESDALIIQAAGQISGASSVGVGISNSLLVHIDTTEASIGDNATVFAGGNGSSVDVPLQFGNVDGVVVTAESQEFSVAVAVGGSGAGTTAVAGSLIERFMIEDTTASIGEGAKINTGLEAGGTNQTVFVAATDDTDLNGGAGVISGAGTAGIGASVDVGFILKTTEASIEKSAEVNAERDVIVRSEADDEINSVTGNLSIGGTVGIPGATNAFAVVTDTIATIGDNAIVHADGNVIVNSDDELDARLAQGTLGLSGSVTVGGGVAILIHTNTTESRIGKNAQVTGLGTKPSYSVSTQLAGDSTLVKGVAVVAESREASLLLAFAGGGSLATSVTGALTDVVMVENTKAIIDEGARINADLTGAGADQDVHVRAEDTTIASDFAFAISLGITAGVGGAVDVGVLTKTTEATIEDGAVVQARDDITVQAETEEFIVSEVVSEGAGFTSTGIAAAIGTWVIVTTAEATIGAATVTAGGNVAVATETKATVAIGTGNFAGGLVAGVGGAATAITHIDTARARISDNAIVTARGNGGPLNVEAGPGDVQGLAVTAFSEELFIGLTGGFSEAANAAINGSVTAQVLVETTEATIGKNAQINPDDDGGVGQDVHVIAESESAFAGAAGSATLAITTIEGGAAVGGAADAGALTKFTTAEIDDDATVNVKGNVIVEALSEEIMVSAAGTAAVSAGIGAAVAGAAGVQLGITTTKARIGRRAKVKADGSVVVTADDDNTMVLTEGNVSAGVASAGASVGIAVIKSETTAVIAEDAVVDALGQGDGVLVRTGTFDVTFDNFSPVAEPDSFETEFNAVLSDTVASNDFDADSDGADLIYTLVMQDEDGNSLGPRRGELVLNADGSFTYTPDAGFRGYDSFVYEVTDETGLKDRAVVRIAVDRNERSPAEDENPESQANRYQQPPAEAVLPTSDNDDINGFLATGGILDESFTGFRRARPSQRVAHGVVVTSTAANQLIKVTATGSGSGGAVAISGAVNVAIVDSTATIGDGAQINQDETLSPAAEQSVLVGAGSDYSTFAFVGAVALAVAPSVAAAPALDLNVLVAETKASIGAGADVSAAADVTVQADANQDALSLSAGFGASGGGTLAGTLSMLFVDSTTHAHVGESGEAITTVDAGGNVLVSARDETDSDVITGSAAIAIPVTTMAAGIGASLAATPILKDTQAYIAQGAIVDAGGNSVGEIPVLNGNLDAGELGGRNARGVAVQAVSTENIFTVTASGAASALSLAGAVVVNYVDSDTQAYIGENARINSTESPDGENQSVNVAAGNLLNIFTVSGAATVSAAGLNGAIDVGILRNDTAAFIGNGARVAAAQDVNVYAVADADVTSVVASVGVGAAALSGSLSIYAIGGDLESDRTVDNPSGGTINDDVLQDDDGNTAGGFFDGSLSDLVDQVTADDGFLGAYLSQDFGDAPDSYTTTGENGASHIAIGPGLGELRDVEADGTPHPLALGDDGLEISDEDGVTVPVLHTGETITVTINITGLAEGETALLDGFIDWSADGSFDGPGEKVFDSVLVTSGINELMIDVPVDAQVGQTFSRFRVSSSGGLSFDDHAVDGEVEDYLVTIAERNDDSIFDFGDAPESYGTLRADNGGRHRARGPMLGTSRDVEGNGLPSALADGDDGDLTDDVDNGDGVVIPELVPGGQVIIEVTASQNARLDAFIDFDGDGQFGPDEKVLDNVAVTAGLNELTIDVPASAQVGQTYARFRLSTEGRLSAIGFADDGEVEDYRVTVFDPDAQPARMNDSEQMLGSISQQARRDVDEAFQSRVEGRVTEDINRPVGSSFGTDIPRGTSALIGDNVVVTSGRDVDVKAVQATDVNLIVGAAGLTMGLGVGASVGLAFIDTPVTAEIGTSTTITAEETIDVIAEYRADSDGFGLVGQVGIGGVSLGGQVLVYEDSSNQTATISDNAVVTRALDEVTVRADADRDYNLQSIGVEVGALSGGAAIAIANVTGDTRASVGNDVRIGVGEEELVRELTIEAVTNDVIDTETIGIAAGLTGAGQGAFAGSTLDIDVEATIGEDAQISVSSSGPITLTSDSQSTVNAEAFGGAAAGVAVGVMLAEATVDGTRRAHLGDRSDIRLDGILDVNANTDNTVTANTVAAVGGIGAGQGNVATAKLFPTNSDGSPDIIAGLGEDVFADAAVFVEANSRGGAKAESLGIVLGVVAIGVNEANAIVSPTVDASIGRGSFIDGDLRLFATHNEDPDGTRLVGKAEAIAGPSGPDAALRNGIALGNVFAGVLAGTGATANAESSAFVTSRLEEGVDVRGVLGSDLVAASFNDADAESNGTTAGVVGVGVVQANAIAGGDTQVLVDENVTIKSGGSIDVNVFADHQADAVARASTIGIAAGQGTVSRADIGVDSDDDRRNTGSGLTRAESRILVANGANLEARRDLDLITDAETDADARAFGSTVGLLTVGISQAFADIRSLAETVVDGATINARGRREIFFNTGGDLLIETRSNNNANARGNASGGGLVDIKGFEGLASIEDSSTLVTIQPGSTLNSLESTTIRSSANNTAEVDGNVSTLGVIGIGATDSEAIIRDVDTLVTVNGGDITGDGDLAIFAEETTRVNADARAAAGGLVSGAGADAFADVALEVDAVINDGVTVDIEGDFLLSATYDPRIEANASGTNDSFLLSAAKVGFSRADAEDSSRVDARLGGTEDGTTTINVGGTATVLAERKGIQEDVGGGFVVSRPTVEAFATGSRGDDLISLFNKNNSFAEVTIDNNIRAFTGVSDEITVGGDFNITAESDAHGFARASNESDQFASFIADDDSESKVTVFSNVTARVGDDTVIDVGQTFNLISRNDSESEAEADGAGEDVSASSDGEVTASSFIDFSTLATVGQNASISAVDAINILAQTDAETRADAELDATDFGFDVAPDTFAYAVIGERQVRPDNEDLFDLDEVSDSELVNQNELPTAVEIREGVTLHSRNVDLFANIIEAESRATAETDAGPSFINNVDADAEALVSVFTSVDIAADANVIGTDRLRLASIIEDVEVRADANAHLHDFVDEDTDADGTAIITSRSEITTDGNARLESSDLLVHSDIVDQDIEIITGNNTTDRFGNQETDRPRIVTEVKIDYDANTLITRDPLTLDVAENGDITANGVTFTETANEVIVSGVTSGSQPGEIEFRLGEINIDQDNDEGDSFPFDDDIGIFDTFTGDPTIEFANAINDLFIENRSDKHLRIQDLNIDDAGGGFPVIQFTGQLFQIGIPGAIIYGPDGVNQMIGNLAAPGDPSDLGAVITSVVPLEIQPQFLEETNRVKFVDAPSGITIRNLGDSQVFLDGQIDAGDRGRVDVLNTGGDIRATQDDQFIRGQDITLNATNGDIGNATRSVSTHLVGRGGARPTFSADASPSDGDVFLSMVGFGDEDDIFNSTVLILAQSISGGGDINLQLDGVGEFPNAWPVFFTNAPSRVRFDRVEAGGDVDIHAQRASFELRGSVVAGGQIRASSEDGGFNRETGNDTLLPFGLFAESAILDFTRSIDLISHLSAVEIHASGIRLINTGDLTIGGLSELVGIDAGVIDITNFGSMTITEDVLASTAGDLRIEVEDTAEIGDDLIVTNDARIRGGGILSLRAGDTLRLDAGTTVDHGNREGVFFSVDQGNADPTEGGTLEVFGLVTSLSLKLSGGTQDDLIRLARVAAGTPTTIEGNNGDDEIIVGDEIGRTGLDEIQSQVDVKPQGDNDLVIIQDGGSDDARTYRVSSDRVEITQTQDGTTGIGAIIFNQSENVLLRTAANLDVVNIEGLNAGVDLTVHSGLGNDEINIANPNGSLDSLQGNVTIIGFQDPGGGDVLTIDDSASNAGGTFTLDGNTIQRQGSGLIKYETVEALEVITTDFADDVTIASTGTPDLETITVQTGGGDDFVRVDGTALNLPVSVDGGSTSETNGDRLLFDPDLLPLTPPELTMPDGTAQADGASVLTYTSFEIVETTLSTFEFAEANFEVNEDGTPVGLAVTINRTGAPEAIDLNASVFVNVAGITATELEDFLGDAIELEFAGGESSKTVMIPIVQNDVAEADETLMVTLTPGDRAELGMQATATVTILDDDQAILSINDVSQAEGDDGTVDFTFTVTLDNDVQPDISVDFETILETLSVDEITPVNGTLMFEGNAGEQHTITVSVRSDSIVELDETFTVLLSNIIADGANVIADSAMGIGMVENDDAAVISISDVTQPEDDGPMIFTITLDQPVDVDALVDFETMTGTADGEDFTIITDTAVITAGSFSTTISVDITADTTLESNERFTVILSNLQAEGRDVMFGDVEATGIISNDDTATIILEAVDGERLEGTGGGTTAFTFSVSLDNNVQGGFDLEYTTNDGTATLADGDYVDNDGTLTFDGTPDSQTITVLVNHNAVLEADELFEVALNSINSLDANIDPNDLVIANSSSIGTILNDDIATITLTPIINSLSENATTNTNYQFEVNVDVAVAGGFTLPFFTNDGNAKLSNGDYVDNDGELIFTGTPNETLTIEIEANDDNVVELDEQFELMLMTATGLLPGVDPGDFLLVNPIETIEILNDDSATLTINNLIQIEGDGGPTSVTWAVTLDHAVDVPLTIGFTTRDGSATAESGDYIAAQGSRRFNGRAGEQKQISVFITGDVTEELDEVFFLDLFNLDASGRDVTFASSTGEVAMTNDDRLLVLSTGPGLPPAITAIDGVSGDLNLGFSAYDDAFLGGVRVASGDVNADGTPDIITGPGAGGGPHVRVFDGTSGEVIREFFALDANFRGGVFVASADLNNDGHDDIIIGADAGGRPHVRVIDGANGGELHSFYPFDPNFTGGVRVATGDVDGNGTPDIITAAGPGGGPHVRIFDGQTGNQIAGNLGSFTAYDQAFTGGVFVGVGDVNSDGVDDLITGPGAGGGPHIRVFSGATQSPMTEFFAYDSNFGGGVRVAVSDINDDGQLEIITSPGAGGGPHVRAFSVNGTDIVEAASFLTGDPTFTGGVFVAGTQNLSGGLNLRADGAVQSGLRIPTLDQPQAQEIFDAALNRLNVGADLDSIAVRVRDLESDVLGKTLPGVIILDTNAAGVGWFIDPTPETDEEFDELGDAIRPEAMGRVDLLSVITHEIAHHLKGNHDHEDEHHGELLSPTLPAGKRRRIESVNEFDQVFGDSELMESILGNLN